jgi:hypothetical protein
MYDSAKLLVDTAIKAHMEMFGVDRETAILGEQRNGCGLRESEDYERRTVVEKSARSFGKASQRQRI